MDKLNALLNYLNFATDRTTRKTPKGIDISASAVSPEITKLLTLDKGFGFFMGTSFRVVPDYSVRKK